MFKESKDAVRLTEESVVVICPNPNCRKEIKEPMLLTILCVTPPEQYEACPYCFAKLQPEEYPEEPEVQELEQEEADLEEDAELDEEAELDEVYEADEEETETEAEADEYNEDLEEDAEEDFELDEPEEDEYTADAPEPEKQQSSGFLQRVKSLIGSGNGSKNDKAEEIEAESSVEQEELEDEAEDLYEEEEMEDEPEDDAEFEEAEDDEEDEEEDLKTEVPEYEPEVEEVKPKAKDPSKTEGEQSGCPAAFGYLANREKDEPIPTSCYVCPRMVDCMLSPRDE